MLNATRCKHRLKKKKILKGELKDKAKIIHKILQCWARTRKGNTQKEFYRQGIRGSAAAAPAAAAHHCVERTDVKKTIKDGRESAQRSKTCVVAA